LKIVIFLPNKILKAIF